MPNANKDFDIGACEGSVAEKYWSKGWLEFALKNQILNSDGLKNRIDKKVKEWWK